MFRTKNIRLKDFLGDNGVYPHHSKYEFSYYTKNKKLDELLLRFEIMYSCIPNKGWSYGY